MMKLTSSRREFSKLMEIRVKNVIVCKKDTLSHRGLIAWASKILEYDFKTLDDMRTGAIYCQILHRLFPKSIILSKVRFFSNMPIEFEANFRLLIAAFMKLRIDRDVPMENLMKGAGNYEFCNWFYQFYLANDTGKPYKAREMRQNSPIGLNRIARELRRSQSIIGFESVRIAPSDNIHRRRCGSVSRIAPRIKYFANGSDESSVFNKHPEVNYCRESKRVQLPPASDSDEDVPVDRRRKSKSQKTQAIPKDSSLGKSCNCKHHVIPKIISTQSVRKFLGPLLPNTNSLGLETADLFKEQEMYILRLRKLHREACDKLDSIKAILLEQHDDPNCCLEHIAALIFNPSPLNSKSNDF